MDNNIIAKAIAEVRKTGKVNMFDRRNVVDVMQNLGYYEEAEYIIDNKDKYIDLLNLSSNY